MRLALISVADKRGVTELALKLTNFGYTIVSTGGTAAALRQAGIQVVPVEQLTGVPEMLDGRVKTLHPAVHGGILARRDRPDHLSTIEALGLAPIDVVAVNLYPFRETIAKPGVTFDEAIEQIDVGGPAMVRAAAKNHAGVLVLVDPDDYGPAVDELAHRRLTPERRKQLACKAFAHTSAYDAAIAAWLGGEPTRQATPTPSHTPLPPTPQSFAEVPSQLADGLTVTLTEPQALRYGENPHQAAWRYRDASELLVGPTKFQVHQGKELSYNNLIDADAAWALLADLPTDRASAAIIKHTNPCGVGVVPTSTAGAILRAFEGDPVSAFGGILAVNRTFDLMAARALGDKFMEVILAPAFDEDALEALAAKPNLRVVTMGPIRGDQVRRQITATAFGVLLQEPDLGPLDIRQATVPTRVQPTESEWRALDIAWRVCKHVKSNAIVLADETGSVGVGAGQMSRVDAAVIAIGKARRNHKHVVAASDAFFPFADGLEALAKGGVKAIVQPGGSKRDAEVIAAADQHGLPMVMTGQRHFRH